MSPSRWVVSVLLACHLGALTLGSLPRPEQLRPVGPPRISSRNALAAALTPTLDSAAAAFSRVHHLSWRATEPLHGFARWYVSLTGLGQRWRMFMNPPTYDEYIQARYYVGASGSTRPAWVATELIFPAHREDHVRLVQSFRDSYTDKAIAIALASFMIARSTSAESPDDTAPDSSDALAPVAGHFARRFTSRYLVAGERVLRTELWIARTPNAAPGTALDPRRLEARLAVLRRYYEGPVQDRRVPREYFPHRAMQTEADLSWVMEYIDQ